MALNTQTDVAKVAQESEVKHLMSLDTTPWYQKPNLRRLYFCLIPAVLGVEMTSGYDGSILNGLQAVKPWLECRLASIPTIGSSRVVMLTGAQISTTQKVPSLA